MKRIAVYSVTGGVGKSFLAANLASSLFQRGIPVVLCELPTHNLLPMHFGANLLNNDSREADKGAIRTGRNVPSLHDDQHFHSHVLHADFTLLSAKSGSGQAFEQRLNAALQLADRVPGMGGLMILDMPTGMQPARNELMFDIELEVIAAEPVSVAAACRRHQASIALDGSMNTSNGNYAVINKKDLRSDLSRDAAVLAESLFGEAVVGSIHYDSAVPEAFVHKALLNDYAPRSQAAMEVSELSRTVADLLELGDNKEKDLA